MALNVTTDSTVCSVVCTTAGDEDVLGDSVAIYSDADTQAVSQFDPSDHLICKLLFAHKQLY